MTTAIFIKSYPNDFEWLSYCLRSLAKFAHGFDAIILVVPPGHGLNLTRETVIEIPEQQPGYLFQQVCKLNADMHTTADFILHLDSDCVLREPVTPESFMTDGKARWLMTPWADCFEAKKVWFHVMAKCCQEAPEHEFMRRNCMMIPRFAYQAFREFIESTHGISMEQYVMNQPGREFSEYNCLGFFLWLQHRDKIAWHDTSVQGVPSCPVVQGWSWAGLTPEIRSELELILA